MFFKLFLMQNDKYFMIFRTSPLRSAIIPSGGGKRDFLFACVPTGHSFARLTPLPEGHAPTPLQMREAVFPFAG